MRKYMVVVREISKGHPMQTDAGNYLPPDITQFGEDIEADTFVIDPCGAITFWENVDEQRARLVMCYAAGQWLRVKPALEG